MNARIQQTVSVSRDRLQDAQLTLSYLESHLLRIFQAVEELASEGNATMQLLAKHMGTAPSDDGRWGTIEGPRNRCHNHIRLLTEELVALQKDLTDMEGGVQ
ncbi:MAG: hypothetical protein ACOY0T_09465 [Myxococcota bacterium]